MKILLFLAIISTSTFLFSQENLNQKKTHYFNEFQIFTGINNVLFNNSKFSTEDINTLIPESKNYSIELTLPINPEFSPLKIVNELLF